MRQLSETGWMHNRARMITASFPDQGPTDQLAGGVKPGSCACWWMATPPATTAAGSGQPEPAQTPRPSFRIFNPALAKQEIRPAGGITSADGCRNWPMCRISTFHEPGKMPTDIQSSCGVHNRPGVSPGDRRPPKAARERALASLKSSRLDKTLYSRIIRQSQR